MKDSRSRIIYVGKARILRHRVRSYFQKINWRTQPKVAAKSTDPEVRLILYERRHGFLH